MQKNMTWMKASMLTIIIVSLLTTEVVCQYKSTGKSAFERPSFSNATKKDSDIPDTSSDSKNVIASATFNLFSHDNYTMAERDKNAEDFNIENYYTISLPAGAITVSRCGSFIGVQV
jgi:hypothetical protein